MPAVGKISPFPFYGNWAGHPISDLSAFYSLIKSERPGKPIVYLAGDSSLDNKAWVPSAGAGGEPLPVDVPAIYKSFLDPPRPKPDVGFWLNHFLGSKATVLNTAVEASLLRDRDAGLLAHDEFIRDHIGAEDVLVVSVGANDIALSPTATTARHMFQLAWLSSRRSIDQGTASSLGYFKTMFCDQTQAYISRITEKQKPKAVIVCMIYYPLEAGAGQTSWADAQLKVLGYNSYPGQLQAAIKKMYEQATSNIKIRGTTVGRAERAGWEKMAAQLNTALDAILSPLSERFVEQDQHIRFSGRFICPHQIGCIATLNTYISHTIVLSVFHQQRFRHINNLTVATETSNALLTTQSAAQACLFRRALDQDMGEDRARSLFDSGTVDIDPTICSSVAGTSFSK
ncbi:hypothetical protein H2203_003291 [Taxawa tesnikishii (nom. ined.)]|nr:hypothetical protein H2203_003291 [Dothideales sp. JES 119]